MPQNLISQIVCPSPKIWDFEEKKSFIGRLQSVASTFDFTWHLPFDCQNGHHQDSLAIKSGRPLGMTPAAKIGPVPFCTLDTVQDFLIKLGIKPCLHILKISIFSLNHVIVRPNKIMNNLLKVCKVCTFKVIFRHQKSTESF